MSSLLYELDPKRIAFEDNPDEYDPEARDIVARLQGDSLSEEELVDLVADVFKKWFGDEVGSRHSYLSIAEALRRRGLA